MMNQTMRYLLFPLLILLVWTPQTWANNPSENFARTIDIHEAQRLLEAGEIDLLLDIRTLEEYEGELGHVPEAYLLPMQELPDRIREIAPYADKTIGLICRTGNRTSYVMPHLARAGFRKLYNIDGGTRDWSQAGYPIAHGKWNNASVPLPK
jgi:rhodanese-related sulfurtransferase